MTVEQTRVRTAPAETDLPDQEVLPETPDGSPDDPDQEVLPGTPDAKPDGPRRAVPPEKPGGKPKHARTRPPRPKPEPGSRPSGLAGVGLSLSLLGALLVGYLFYLFALTPVQEARMQHNLYATFRGRLAQAVAPLGSPARGEAVAILEIPRIHLRAVVVEGTAGEDLTRGPGHWRGSPLPGQAGISEIFGRRATFGAPFRDLDQLSPGDTIKATTGQGVATYKVVAWGNSGHPVIDKAPNRLILVTADSNWIPNHWIEVDADLTSTAQPDPGNRPITATAEKPLKGDGSALILSMVWGLALAVSSIAATALTRVWARWPTYLAMSPVFLAVVWNLYENLSALNPNLY